MTSRSGPPLSGHDGAALPRLVRVYLDRAVGDFDRVPQRVRVTQQGRMRTTPGGRWMRFTATEDFQVRRVGFRWRARFPLGPLAWLSAVDEYAEGGDRLRVRLYGVLPVVRAGGDAAARAQAQRYLSELFWTPHAIAANHELRWREVDDHAVEVATAVGPAEVALRLDFDEHGDIAMASTPSHARLVGTKAVDTPWRGHVGDFAVLGGIRVPTRAEVGWDLPEGLFVYWQGRITGVELGWRASGTAA